MANRYSRTFTLKDLFNDKSLSNKFPMVNYKETTTDLGKVSRRTNMKTVPYVVYDIAVKAARPYYKPLKPRKSGGSIFLEGNLNDDLTVAYKAVYCAVVESKDMISITANNMDLIRSALKESEKKKASFGETDKLYLRVQSKEQIKGMSKREIAALLNNIMENIYYSDDFIETQKKYGLADMPTGSPYSYEERKNAWQRRVGEI
jgi:hypothetical protein